MRIQVKLGGDLKRYADSGGALESDGPLTVAAAMQKLGLEETPDEVLAIVNDEVVPPAERAERKLEENDKLTLMPQLKGG